MKFGLIGHGAMGRLIATRGQAGGHTLAFAVSRSQRPPRPQLVELFRTADVLIDFSSAETVLDNVQAAITARRPLVIGTTGWSDQLPEVRKLIASAGGAMVFGANFSIGVNIFYRLTRQAAGMFAATSLYEPFIEEQHHSRKKDSPSGTALKLKQLVDAATGRSVSVAATRAGDIPGTHRVGFDCSVDQVLLTHTARSREGFADGALVAGAWIIGKSGVFEFDQVMDEVLASPG